LESFIKLKWMRYETIRDEVVKTVQECGMDVDTVVRIPGSMKAPFAAKRLLPGWDTYRVATRVHEARRNGDSRAGNRADNVGYLFQSKRNELLVLSDDSSLTK
jgi:hypothetical protein